MLSGFAAVNRKVGNRWLSDRQKRVLDGPAVLLRAYSGTSLLNLLWDSRLQLTEVGKEETWWSRRNAGSAWQRGLMVYYLCLS